MPKLDAVLAELCAIMAPYAAKLDSRTAGDAGLYVDTRHVQKNGNPLFFGAVQMKKAYVSYHLMPVYLDPGLLAGISSELRAKMQGKSCFNFKGAEAPTLLKELAALTEAGYASYKEQGLV